MNAPFRPIGKQILIEKEPYRPTEEKGILIPESADRTPRFSPTIRGTVLGVGSKVNTERAGRPIREGDQVALKRVAGDDLEIGGRLLTICIDKEIIGFIE